MKNKKKCIIVGAGEFSNVFLNVTENDFLIAADGGCEYITKEEQQPDLWIGDMDSTKMQREEMKFEEGQWVKLPCQKDDTDTLAAIRIGLSKGYRFFELHGMLGGRLDHSLANIACLEFLKRNGAEGILFGRDTLAVLIENQSLRFKTAPFQIISVFAWGKEAKGVTEEGLLYEVQDVTLTPEYPIGISNEPKKEEAVITVKDGKLLVVMTFCIEKGHKKTYEEIFDIQ